MDSGFFATKRQNLFDLPLHCHTHCKGHFQTHCRFSTLLLCKWVYTLAQSPAMKRRISISLYLDVRYKLKTGRYPVKLQCNAKENGKWRQIYLMTGVELSTDEWEKIRNLEIRDKSLKRKRELILTCEANAINLVKDTPFMTLDTLSSLDLDTRKKDAAIL